ncbi:hypothetical protein GINT2_001731 [Glugoides intestinalis]
MNSSFFKVTEDLKDAYYKCFESKSDKKVFQFLKKYLQFVENDSSSFNVLMLFENPLHKSERRSFMKELNGNCRRFLEEKQRSKNNATIGEALCYVGVGYEYGLFGYKRDCYAAFEAYVTSSRLSNGLGTYKLAQCFEKGKGTSQDIGKALYFYRCAAKLGLVDALHVYGAILANGYLRCSIDHKTGLHYLSLAAVKASNVYPYPLFDIGKWYETKQETLDTFYDEEYSFKVYMKGANLNDPNSQYRIARCFENGELKQTRSIATAVQWYKRAADNGQTDAQMMLFGLYSSGINGVLNKDSGKSYYWALCTGIRGNARAVFFLGEYSRNGIGIESDILLALWWYTISASMGSYEAKVKMRETRAEIEKRDIGPEIPYKCCGIVFYCGEDE